MTLHERLEQGCQCWNHQSNCFTGHCVHCGLVKKSETTALPCTVTEAEMNEFIKNNPEYAEEFYKQMKEKYGKDEEA